MEFEGLTPVSVEIGNETGILKWVRTDGQAETGSLAPDQLGPSIAETTPAAILEAEVQ